MGHLLQKLVADLVGDFSWTKCFQTENKLTKESLCFAVVCPAEKKKQSGFSSGRFLWFSKEDPGAMTTSRIGLLTHFFEGLSSGRLDSLQGSQQGTFSFSAPYFPLLSVCQPLWFGVTVLNGNVDSWFASKQCFFQVISLGSRKPAFLCFFRD